MNYSLHYKKKQEKKKNKQGLLLQVDCSPYDKFSRKKSPLSYEHISSVLLTLLFVVLSNMTFESFGISFLI